MKKIILTMSVITAMSIYLLSSCYKNKEDILAIPKISFRGDVVPIMVSGGCGCHNNGQAQRAVQFSHADTIYYDAILSRSGLFETWVNGGVHPGEGSIEFTTTQANIIKQWIAEGAKDDGGGCNVTGAITYTNNISAIYNTTCKGSTCHGGIAVALDYNTLVAKKAILTTIMNSGGTTGHTGPSLSLSSCTANTILEWIAQGTPQ